MSNGGGLPGCVLIVRPDHEVKRRLIAAFSTPRCGSDAQSLLLIEQHLGYRLASSWLIAMAFAEVAAAHGVLPAPDSLFRLARQIDHRCRLGWTQPGKADCLSEAGCVMTSVARLAALNCAQTIRYVCEPGGETPHSHPASLSGWPVRSGAAAGPPGRAAFDGCGTAGPPDETPLPSLSAWQKYANSNAIIDHCLTSAGPAVTSRGR